MQLNLTKRYGTKTVFENFDLEFLDGKTTCILGASGAGKTTLLHCLAGLTEYDGTPLQGTENVGFVFQEARLLPYSTVEENIFYVGATVEETERALRLLEIEALAKKYPDEISGGEKQRVALARAIAKSPKLLLLDEPFSSLDLPLKIRLTETLKKLCEAYKPTVVFVTHDIDEALAVGHSVCVIKDGKIAYSYQGEPCAYGENSQEKRQIIRALTK